MSLQQRLARLESVEYERELLRRAERLAAEYGRSVDDVLRQWRETSERVARWGMDAELRRVARHHGKREDEVRADYERIVAELTADESAQFGSEDAG